MSKSFYIIYFAPPYAELHYDALQENARAESKRNFIEMNIKIQYESGK